MSSIYDQIKMGKLKSWYHSIIKKTNFPMRRPFAYVPCASMNGGRQAWDERTHGIEILTIICNTVPSLPMHNCAITLHYIWRLCNKMWKSICVGKFLTCHCSACCDMLFYFSRVVWKKLFLASCRTWTCFIDFVSFISTDSDPFATLLCVTDYTLQVWLHRWMFLRN